jgi:hypothetical protein
MSSPRIRQLQDDLASLQADLAEAPTAAHAADIRADIGTVRHSLWLAGWEPEEEAA